MGPVSGFERDSEGRINRTSDWLDVGIRESGESSPGQLGVPSSKSEPCGPSGLCSPRIDPNF